MDAAKSETSDGWGKGAGSYDAFSVFTVGFTAASTQILCQELAPPAAEGPLRVLDVAAGNGASTFALAAVLASRFETSGTVVDITATDFSSAMIEKLNASLSSGACGDDLTTAIQSGRVKICSEVADAQDHHGFQDASFDAISCSFGLMFPPCPEKVVEEFWRLLKPGGIAVVSCWHYLSLGDEIINELVRVLMQREPEKHPYRQFGDESFLRKLFRGDVSEAKQKLWSDGALEFRTISRQGTLSSKNVAAMLNSNPVCASYGKWDEDAAIKHLNEKWAGPDGNIVIRGTSSVLVARKPGSS